MKKLTENYYIFNTNTNKLQGFENNNKSDE